MPATANDLIVIGIGPGSEILTLLTFGLGIGVTALVDLTLDTRSVDLTLDTRSVALTLEDK